MNFRSLFKIPDFSLGFFTRSVTSHPKNPRPHQSVLWWLPLSREKVDTGTAQYTRSLCTLHAIRMYKLHRTLRYILLNSNSSTKKYLLFLRFDNKVLANKLNNQILAQNNFQFKKTTCFWQAVTEFSFLFQNWVFFQKTYFFDTYNFRLLSHQ